MNTEYFWFIASGIFCLFAIIIFLSGIYLYRKDHKSVSIIAILLSLLLTCACSTFVTALLV